MSIRNLDRMFEPRSVALLGAGGVPGSAGALLARNLLRSGFQGPLLPVDPTGAAVEGVPSYRDVASLPLAPDLAIIATPPERVPGLVGALAARGTRAVVAIGRASPGAGARWQEVLDAARPHTLRVIGPNCVGLLVPPLRLNASCAPVSLASGHVAFAAQSGALVTSVLDWASARGIGFSCAVCLGDMADVDFGDLLDYLANDPATRAILLYLEAVTNGRKFMSAGRAAARSKPVIVVKAGRHGAAGAAAAAASLVGALAASDAVYDAALRRAGMLRVLRLEDLFGAFETLAGAPLPRGDRLAIAANGAGLGTLAADALVDAGGQLAPLSAETRARLAAALAPGARVDHPLDLGGDAGAERYADALGALLEEPAADAVLAIHGPTAAAPSADVARALAARIGESPRAVLLTSFVGGSTAAEGRRIAAEHGLASYPTPERAARAFVHLASYRRNQELLMETPPSIPEAFSPDPARARAAARAALTDGRGALGAAEAAELLLAYGFELTGDLAGAPAARGSASTAEPAACRELFAGSASHPVFGPVVLFGAGGADAERRADAAAALPPLNVRLARELIERTQTGRRLRAGGPTRVDLDAVALALVRVAQLVADVPELVELDLHPLVAGPEGVAVAGARIRVAPATGPGEARLAIRPYPRELEERVMLADGRSLLLRPIQPEDEPSLRSSFAKLTSEEVRLRFFAPLKTLSHAMAARFTQLDYDREMALVLTDPGPAGTTDVYGVVRLHADPDNERAEFAIVVRHDVTRRGLGTLLVQRILDYARSRGIGELFGDVLRENGPMRALCKRLGFGESVNPDDPAVVRVRLPLRAR